MSSLGSCKTCKNYTLVGVPIGANGECRGGVPQAILMLDQTGKPLDKFTFWPQPEPTKWCAQFIPRLSEAH